jgi:hypothetical protein
MRPRRLALTREQIVRYRRVAGALDERLPAGTSSLRRAAWAGLQDSMPRAAVLSIHARVDGTMPDTWEDPSLVQVWGPRFSAYVVAKRDVAVFTLGRLPESGAGRHRADDLARRLHAYLDGRTMPFGEAGRGMGVQPNSLRYAAATGTVRIHWDGARQPTIWTVAPPDVDPGEARLELARRYLRAFGPATAATFARWAGIRPAAGRAAFGGLTAELMPVETEIGEAWILTRDEPAFRAPGGPTAPARLLPSGDTHFLLQGADRELLVPDPARRRELWTSRVWPGAVLVDGEIAGTWRRAQGDLTIDAWKRLSRAQREAVEAEAATMPLPGIPQGVRVHWGD